MIPHGAIEEWFGAIYQGVDYSWRFEVSTFGRLRNAKTKHVYSFGYGDGGYLQACVSVNGRRLNVHVHRCVAETFLPNECGYEIVNHMDGCKQHNDVWNLEWCTRKENYFSRCRYGANRLRCAISDRVSFTSWSLFREQQWDGEADRRRCTVYS